MYFLHGAAENTVNVLALASTLGRFDPSGFRDLKQRYYAFLQDFQPGVRHSASLDDPFVEDSAQEEQLASVFARRSLLDDRLGDRPLNNPISLERKRKLREDVKDALAYLESRCPGLVDLFSLAVRTIFFYDSPGLSGGTTSEAVGVIWVNAKPHWTTQDLVEFLIHEFTHNLVFIDELRYKHFHYALLPRKENYALSAILGVERPLDKVLHSIVVAYEVLEARGRFLGDAAAHVHPPSQVLRRKLEESVQSVLGRGNIDELLTTRGLSLVREVDEKLRSSSLSPIAETASA